MNSKFQRLSTRQPLIALIAACIAACGGGGDATDADDAGGTAHGALQAAPFYTTLLSDDGSIMMTSPQTVPADAAARTRAGRYASTWQAEELERALGDRVVRVNVECCGAEAVEQAISIGYGMQAAADLPNSAPVLVRAADLRLGAVAANRLAEAGYGNVWLVTR
jgi:hypothetical protein